MRRTLFYLSVALLAFGGCFSGQKVSAQTVRFKTQDKSDYTIPCADKNLRAVWDKIKSEFNDDTTDYLTDIGVKNCRDMFEVLRVADLNADGKPEIFIRQIADCPIANCTFWIFQKKKNDYQSILDGDEIQLFELKKTKTNGYIDVQLRTPNSAASHYYQVFKFNGVKYTPRKCWWEDYMIPDKQGNYREVKKPQIRYEKCGEYDYVNSTDK